MLVLFFLLVVSHSFHSNISCHQSILVNCMPMLMLLLPPPLPLPLSLLLLLPESMPFHNGSNVYYSIESIVYWRVVVFVILKCNFKVKIIANTYPIRTPCNGTASSVFFFKSKQKKINIEKFIYVVAICNVYMFCMYIRMGTFGWWFACFNWIYLRLLYNVLCMHLPMHVYARLLIFSPPSLLLSASICMC